LISKILQSNNLLRKFFHTYKYGDIGYFSKKQPHTNKYYFANWGSRKWEYFFIEQALKSIGIKEKNVIDIGIGLPEQHNFYTFYVKSGCFLTALDPDGRLDELTILSDKCKIIRQSAENIKMHDASVDIVISISTMEHMPLPVFQRTIEEIHRVLKPNALFIGTLDLTYDKIKSAPWAILEKTINGLPEYENEIPLQPHHQPLTVDYFLNLIHPFFHFKNGEVHNNRLTVGPEKNLIYSSEWNSHVAYFRFHKKTTTALAGH